MSRPGGGVAPCDSSPKNKFFSEFQIASWYFDKTHHTSFEVFPDQNCPNMFFLHIWDKVLKSGLSKFCEK